MKVRQHSRTIPPVTTGYMMADECCDVSRPKIVTEFLLSTCQLPLRPSGRDVPAARCCIEAELHCARTAGSYPVDDKDAEYIPLTTGSVAEFYIEPMLAHVGDIDVMYHRNNQLAIPRGHPPPTQLPAEFHNNVSVHEIIDSQFPGYVYLERSCLGLLKQCPNDGAVGDGNYKLHMKYATRRYLLNVSGDGENIHGPAMFSDNCYSSQLSVDAVPCIRCLSWPPQAADWRTRHRNNDWPDSATLDRVVSNGCDVVGVAHRQCRQDMRQHRLSFSRAEIVLINSWTPVQQIAYHVLRTYVKMERLTESADNTNAGTLSNYHIKTLILWACELKSSSWWTDNNLVRICAELLKNLSVWLTDTRCPHYFIDNCNILDNSFNLRSVASKLMSLDEEYLSTWLINNCMEKMCSTVSDFNFTIIQ